jgi:hypothetical protein
MNIIIHLVITRALIIVEAFAITNTNTNTNAIMITTRTTIKQH